MSRYRIPLNSGWEISLQELSQYRTHAGLLEGLPSASFNRDAVKKALQYAKEKLWNDVEPLLVPPKESAIRLPEDLLSHYSDLKGSERRLFVSVNRVVSG
jgi:hypothetical protein